MGDSLQPGEALVLLGRAFRERSTGVLTLGRDRAALRVVVREGQVTGLVLPPAARPARLGPDDTQLRLERVLAEVGIGPKPRREPAKPTPAPRDRLLAALAASEPAVFDEGAEAPPNTLGTAGATDPLILEGVRQLPDRASVRHALGDPDLRVVPTAALAEGRTLTISEGSILSKVDGTATVRDLVARVPLDPEDTERTLLGLLLTGRVELRPPLPALVPQARPSVEPSATAVPADPSFAAPPQGPADSVPGEVPVLAGAPIVAPSADHAEHLVPAFPPEGRLDTPTEPMTPIDPQVAARRQEILDLFHALPLKNHFEVLGVGPGSSDAAVKRAYVTLAKRFHPDVQHDTQLGDLKDALEAIFIRVGEAWDELRDASNRLAYASRLTHGQPQPTRLQAPTQSSYVAPEDTLLQAQFLLAQSRYWDLIQLLEGAIPKMERYQSRARILLARAYAKNPNWLRRAEETLHQVLRDEPGHVDAHYDLGLLYKAGGLAARAQAMFRRTLELRPDHRDAAAELAAESSAPSGGLLKRLFGRGRAS